MVYKDDLILSKKTFDVKPACPCVTYEETELSRYEVKLAISLNHEQYKIIVSKLNINYYKENNYCII
jgi:hypothetical protein